jgi:AcrR family transcriptional regulator
VPAVNDPAATLSPTAKRLLAAARRVLARDGFSGLTVEAITAEAGENKAAVGYHFGSKNALIATLVDWIDHDDSAKLIDQLSDEVSEDDRLDVLLTLQREGCRSVADNQMFFELLPHMLRDRALRPRLARLYEWYRDLDAWVLAPGADTDTKRAADNLAALAIAVNDGLTLQYAADHTFDVEGVFAAWERLLRSALAELLQAQQRAPEAREERQQSGTDRPPEVPEKRQQSGTDRPPEAPEKRQRGGKRGEPEAPTGQ